MNGDGGDVEAPTHPVKAAGSAARQRRPTAQLQRLRDLSEMQPLTRTPGSFGDRLVTVLDALNGVALTAGVFLRSSVVARICFVLYLLLLHAWSFVVLSLRTTSFEAVHGDTGGSFEEATAREEEEEIFLPPGMRSQGFGDHRADAQW